MTRDINTTDINNRTLNIRPPAVAGMFYPGQSRTLHQEIQACLAAANDSRLPAGSLPKALVLPHAGYVYSGPVAASGYRLLAAMKHRIQRVVLLGPSHRVALRGIALPTQDAFATPLGNIVLDTGTIKHLATLPHCGFLDAAHAQEHSLEVHLPFLQETLGDFTLVPMVVGETTADDVAQVLEQVWGGDETVIIISSDLSHYLPYALATDVDRHTADRIVQRKTDLEGEEACGCRPLNGLLLAAQRHNLHGTVLDLRNSGDTAGPRDRVVGYGAFAFA